LPWCYMKLMMSGAFMEMTYAFCVNSNKSIHGL
jgi:hypothetical protein